MSTLLAFWNSLPKSYTAAAGLLVVAAVQLFLFKDPVSASQSFMAALATVGLRSAIAKESAKALAATQDAVLVASTTAANVATYAAKAQK